MRTAKAQISLRNCAVLSGALLFANSKVHLLKWLNAQSQASEQLFKLSMPVCNRCKYYIIVLKTIWPHGHPHI